MPRRPDAALSVDLLYILQGERFGRVRARAPWRWWAARRRPSGLAAAGKIISRITILFASVAGINICQHFPLEPTLQRSPSFVDSPKRGSKRDDIMNDLR